MTMTSGLLSREEMDRRMDAHFGFEVRDDVEGVLATLSHDVEHDIVGWPAGPTHGRDATRGFYEALFQDLSDGRITTLRRLYGETSLSTIRFGKDSRRASRSAFRATADR